MQTLQKLGVVTWRMRQSSFVGRKVVALFKEKLEGRQMICGEDREGLWWCSRWVHAVVPWRRVEPVHVKYLGSGMDSTRVMRAYSPSLPNSRISTLHSCATPSLSALFRVNLTSCVPSERPPLRWTS